MDFPETIDLEIGLRQTPRSGENLSVLRCENMQQADTARVPDSEDGARANAPSSRSSTSCPDDRAELKLVLRRPNSNGVPPVEEDRRRFALRRPRPRPSCCGRGGGPHRPRRAHAHVHPRYAGIGPARSKAKRATSRGWSMAALAARFDWPARGSAARRRSSPGSLTTGLSRAGGRSRSPLSTASSATISPRPAIRWHLRCGFAAMDGRSRLKGPRSPRRSPMPRANSRCFCTGSA